MSNQNWNTPADLIDKIKKRYHIGLDPCSNGTSVVGARIELTEGGLEYNWESIDTDREIVFVNPPYSKVGPWVEKAASSDVMALMLLPAATSTRWFQFVLSKHWRFFFFPKRLKFIGASSGARFDSVLIQNSEIWTINFDLLASACDTRVLGDRY